MQGFVDNSFEHITSTEHVMSLLKCQVCVLTSPPLRVRIMQGFVDNSFEHITSTEHAMSLLQQFQAILQRETLRQDLESK